MLGSSHKSERYWKETLKEKLMQQFEFCLFPDELNPDLSLDTTITVPQLVIVRIIMNIVYYAKRKTSNITLESC